MAVTVMVVMAALLVVGLGLTFRWLATPYRPWAFPGDGGGAGDGDGDGGMLRADRPGVRAVALRYLRGVAVALVAGFWAGILVTGPAVRLIMRLLAVTGGDDAQGRITEADEVVGKIELGGTIGLVIFGGILPGLLSGAIYLVCRRLLPGGWWAGVTFGGLHLVVAATRLDPLRPDNPDFDLVGPGWLAALTFGLTAVAHGMAVVAIANRYSHELPPEGGRVGARAIAPLVLPALLLIPGAPLLLPIGAGLVLVVVVTRLPAAVRAARSPALVTAGRAAVAVAALALLPGAATDVYDVVVRDDTTTAAPAAVRDGP